MSKTVVVWILMMVTLAACAGERGVPLVEPTSDFSLNFCNFPHAWTVARGEAVTIGIVTEAGEAADRLTERTAATAPDARIVRIPPLEFYGPDAVPAEARILLLAAAPPPAAYGFTLNRIEEAAARGAIVILPAYFGPMEASLDYGPWRDFVRGAGRRGALIVGVHGRFYQLGALPFWRQLPVDVHVVHRRVDGDRARASDFMIPEPLEAPAYLGAGAAALLMSREPGLSADEVKARFHTGSRRITWLLTDIEWREGEYRLEAKLNPNMVARRAASLEEHGHKILDRYEAGCLDAARLLGLEPPVEGVWTRRVLRIPEALERSTGRGVTVAILDHMFEREDWSLKDRVVKPSSVLEGAPVFDPETGLGHGTWMARDLVKVAPDVRVMPVRFCGRGRYGDPDLYIKGIDTAVENGADVVSISHQPIPEERQDDFDAAVERAVSAGVTIVYIHYRGKREDVVVSRPIEFAGFYEKGDGAVYVVGTNFIGEDSFPATWGFSGTAPIVAGVIALMKQLRPGLNPSQIASILRASGRRLPSGLAVLDAVFALDNSR